MASGEGQHATECYISEFCESSISVASHYPEAGFVNIVHRIGHLKCKRNCHGRNPLRQFLACNMLYQNLRFCPGFGVFWPLWRTKSVKGRKSHPLSGTKEPWSAPFAPDGSRGQNPRIVSTHRS